jgi:two-component system sensor histidine kinase CreC
MKLGLRLLLGFFLITGIAAFFVLRVFVAEVRPSVREVMEDVMVDTANLLAELATDDLAALPPEGSMAGTRFAQRVRDYADRPIDARIWGLSKRTLDYRVYVTDAKGRVVFDTGFRTPEPKAEQGGGGSASSMVAISPVHTAEGQDYSGWIDVSRTLKGQYGARATREVYRDDRSSTMYVAAPVRQGNHIIGVLTVAKPMSTVQKFIDRAERDILISGLWLLGLSLAVGVVVTGWIVWSVRRLRHFAQHVELGQRDDQLAPPQLPGELGDLAQAMQGMRERLAGHAHIEQMVRAMTHELKSPLAAIGGAAELLREDLPAADRQLFAQQVQDQTARLHALVEQLLELSKLDHRRSLDHQRLLWLPQALQPAIERAKAQAAQRQVRLVMMGWDAPAAVQLMGEAELLQMALGNVLDNALDFAPAGSEVRVSLRAEGGELALSVQDQGPGVPDYALARLGERFYSTPRPAGAGQTERKGSGLGLAIAQQIMALHGGHIDWVNTQPGLRVTLRFKDFTLASPSTSPPHLL